MNDNPQPNPPSKILPSSPHRLITSSSDHAFTRRSLLRSAGVAIALPWLAATAGGRAFAAEPAPPRRMVCICTPLGLHPPALFPTQAGEEYETTPYLNVLKDFRQQTTVMSGLAHPGVDSGHDSIYSFLTTAPHPERRAGFRNTISLDQVAAEHLVAETRFSSLALSHEGFGISWTRSGALVPPDTSPSRVFARLFLDGKPEEIQAQVRRLQNGRSVLDAVGEQVQQLEGDLGAGDRDKLDEYLTSVRELERRLARAEQWSRKPKPKVDVPKPQDIANSADMIGRTRLMFDLTHLALQTDSTRVVTMLLGGTSLVPPIPGVSQDHHNLSHHGQDPGKIGQLEKVELELLRTLRDLLAKLQQSTEGGETLLDRTMVLFGSNLGSGSSHSCRNLPMLLCGGGFRHGRHLAFDEKNHPPLANLFVSMLQRIGMETDQFGSGTGTLKGLEVKG